MPDRLKLLCVLAHPDDESLGCGGVIAWSVAHDIEAYLVCATRGERGWTGPGQDNPGHIAVSQFTHAALVWAADQSYRDPGDQAPHRVAKLYWQVDTQDLADRISALPGGPLSMPVDGKARVWTPFPELSITTRLDAGAHWQIVRRGVQCHRTPLPTLPDMDQLSDEQHQLFRGQPTLYRVYSCVNGGRRVEHDLFAGLR